MATKKKLPSLSSAVRISYVIQSTRSQTDSSGLSRLLIVSQGTYWTNEQAAEAVLASLHSKLMAEQIFSGAAECDEHGIIYSMRVYW